MRRAILGSVLLCSALALGLSGCSHGSVMIGSTSPHASHGRHGHGPPPYAPAHGHRWKHRDGDRDVELVFDSDLGVYVVIDVPNRYYWDGYYLRIEDGDWYASTRLEGRWEPRSSASLPPGLRKKHAHHGDTDEHPGHGHAPAKGDW
jgi:hypothetical protein